MLHLAVTTFLAVALAALGVTTATLLRRASRSRQALAVEIHERSLGLDRRCDFLGDVLFAVKERHDTLVRIDHLFDLVACGEREGHLAPKMATALRRHVLDLRSEALATLPDPDHRA